MSATMDSIEVAAMDNGQVHFTVKANYQVVQFDMKADEAERFGLGLVDKAKRAREISS